MRIDLPPPVLALIASGRRVLTAPPLHATTSGTSPDVLTDYALRHGMLAWAPDLVRHDAVIAHMARSLQAVRQLLDIVQRFERNGIAVVALKGPAFSQWLYGDPAARRYNDLDLLVSVETRESARHLLEQIGFQRRIPGAAGDLVYASVGAWPMVHARQLDVDLHWSLASRRFPPPLDPADVMRGAVHVPIGGGIVCAPRPEHAAIITLTHSAKHLWYSLELPFSIAALVGRTDVDWSLVRELAVQAGTLRGAAAGLVLAAELFALDTPAAFRRDIGLADVRDLCRGARTTLALPPGTFADRRLERRLHLLAFDRRADRLLYDVRRLTEPTRAEWEWLSLPSAPAPLYWPARLVRLAMIALNTTSGARDAPPSAH